jgi:hypothetical protein
MLQRGFTLHLCNTCAVKGGVMTNNVCIGCDGSIKADYKPDCKKSARIVCDFCWKGVIPMQTYYSRETLIEYAK